MATHFLMQLRMQLAFFVARFGSCLKWYPSEYPGPYLKIFFPSVIPPQVQDFTIPLVTLLNSPVCPFLQSVHISLGGCTVTPPSFVSSEILLRVHSVPPSRSLIKMLYRTEFSIGSWDWLMMIHVWLHDQFHLQYTHLVSPLWMSWRQLSRNSIYQRQQ